MFAHPDGDHMTLLNVFRGYAAVLPHDVYKNPFSNESSSNSSRNSSSAARSWCDEHFLSLKVLERAAEIRSRLSGMVYSFVHREKNLSVLAAKSGLGGSSRKGQVMLASSYGLAEESALIRRYVEMCD